jgi:hypothetical protein
VLQRHGVIDIGERQVPAIERERDRGLADQVLDLPAVLGAPPDLDVAVLGGDQENLLDRGSLR